MAGATQAVRSPTSSGGGGARRASVGRGLARAAVFVLAILVLAAMWELYRLVWTTTGWTRPFVVNDISMPHVWTILNAFVEPAQVNQEPLGVILFHKAVFTAKEALAGFVLGGVFGFALGTLLAHSRWVQRGLLPYVVASQTIPILAIAPMVVIWVNPKLPASLQGWGAVAVIAAYLTFFPVAINTLRGMHSADPRALQLMRSYAAGTWSVLWKVRFPASLPYIFSALKIAATASVVGAIIGELPSGLQDGLGGAILNFNQYYSIQPEKLWATNIVAAALGIVFFLVIVLVEKLVVHRAPERVA